MSESPERWDLSIPPATQRVSLQIRETGQWGRGELLEKPQAFLQRGQGNHSTNVPGRSAFRSGALSNFCLQHIAGVWSCCVVFLITNKTRSAILADIGCLGFHVCNWIHLSLKMGLFRQDPFRTDGPDVGSVVSRAPTRLSHRLLGCWPAHSPTCLVPSHRLAHPPVCLPPFPPHACRPAHPPRLLGAHLSQCHLHTLPSHPLSPLESP